MEDSLWLDLKKAMKKCGYHSIGDKSCPCPQQSDNHTFSLPFLKPLISSYYSATCSFYSIIGSFYSIIGSCYSVIGSFSSVIGSYWQLLLKSFVVGIHLLTISTQLLAVATELLGVEFFTQCLVISTIFYSFY